MIWKYEGLSKISGEKILGQIDGRRKDVLRSLENDGLTSIILNLDLFTSLKWLLKTKRVKAYELSIFFEDLSYLYVMDFGVNNMLTSLKDTTVNKVLIDTINKTMKAVNKGVKLSTALCQTGVFPKIVKSILEACEQAGKFPVGLQDLSQYFLKESNRKSKILQALIYPVVVFIVLIIFILFLCFKIIPNIKEVLPKNIMENPATNLLLFLSNSIVHFWWLGIIIPTGLIILYLKNSHKYKTDTTALIYKIPIFGNILKELTLVTYFKTLHLMLKSGIPIIAALDNIHKINQNYISEKFQTCSKYIMGGSSFHEAIEKDEFFPKVVGFTIKKGEDTAKLTTYCHFLSEYFVKRADKKIDTMIAIIPHALILVCFSILLLVVLAFFVPIYLNLGEISAGNF